MAIAPKLLEINQVKEDLKQAIIDKGVDMTGVPFTEYADKVAEISGGGGETFDEYLRRMAYFYGQAGFDVYDTWKQQISNSSQQLYDIDVTLVAPAQNLGGMDVDLYIGSADLTNLYNDCVSNDYEGGRVFIINDVAVRYYGDISADVEFPIPIFSFGSFDERTLSVESFLIADLTPMGMGLGISLAKVAGIPVANNNIVIKKGFEHNPESVVVFPENLKYISDFAFHGWSEVSTFILNPTLERVGISSFYNIENFPIAPTFLPNSIKYIGASAFQQNSNLGTMIYLPNVITIGDSAFRDIPNLKYVIIGDKVVGIWDYAFRQLLVTSIEYVEIHATTPPDLGGPNVFYTDSPSPYPIYVPDASKTAYQSAPIWSSIASRIKGFSEK